MDEIVEYIIKFILGNDNEDKSIYVAYGKNSVTQSTRVIIEKSIFFDEDVYLTLNSIPKNIYYIDGIPILYGNNIIVEKKGILIVGADIIASTYFMISRYEECVNRKNRDEHGRFCGEKSFAARNGFLMRPVVEEYGVLLRKWLRKQGVECIEPKCELSHIYLTHDVDVIYQWSNLYRALRTLVKRLITNSSNKLESIKSLIDYKKYDSVYTFPYICELDNSLKSLYRERISSIYFFKAGGFHESDNGYYKKPKVIKELASYLEKNDAECELHLSYSAGENTGLIKEEVEYLSQLLGKKITKQRNHYLNNREPEDMRALIDAGITEDFTMGYARTVGFRLGTCRPVKWIDPIKKKLTNLTLHHLTVMDCSLDDGMKLDEIQAMKRVLGLIKEINKYNGEVSLLWHNTSLSGCETKGYRKRLYENVIGYLCSMLM